MHGSRTERVRAAPALGVFAAAAVGVIAIVAAAMAQSDRAATDAMARRVNERIRALQAEADRLASQSRTLLGDLRQLEIQRDIAAETVKTANATLAQAQAGLQQATDRLAALEQQREAQLPDLKVRLVDIYKRGRGGYARMLLDVHGVREFARALRAVAALTTINDTRISEHRHTLENLRHERDAMQQRTRELEAAAKDADRARLASQRAIAAREALLTQIDQRRDLNAQLAGELDVAYRRLQDQLANAAAGRPAEAVAVPLASFRGALDWPVAGRFTRARNGIEISAPEGTPVAAVHPGTVDYADAFSGFGNMVIVDHGGNYFSLYGYLASAEVARGDHVDAGTQLGRVGTAPTGPPSLYFELRVDGRSVDPLQWLKAR
ncbi:MAG TPA: peptidoglycan DD-metalloendopeptidase family protein [Vicinamibacterales bacterium]|jgi:septal ring factor EnvC (AmiA/AmiB activator)|nr:peptidoglycan DD-metalloendopeptidase family protein [Vicinamibacterales bacterium]